jgi:hypothetical protein
MSDELEIIIDDAPGASDGGTPAVVVSDNPEDGIAELKRQLAERDEQIKAVTETAERNRIIAQDAERRRQQAERVAVDSIGKASTANKEAETRQLESISNGISATTGQLANLKAAYVRAQTDGDFDKAGDIQIEMGKLSADLRNLEAGKAQLEGRRTEEKAEAPPQQQAQETQDQFNSRPWTEAESQFVMNNQAAATADWMRRHPQYFSDPSFRKLVQNAHEVAVGRKILPNTDAYFEMVETISGLRTAPEKVQEQSVSTAAKATERSGPAPAAPVSRTVPSSDGSSSGKQTVRLTPAQIEFARINFPREKPTDPAPEVRYAKHLIALEKEGRLKGDGRSL